MMIRRRGYLIASDKPRILVVGANSGVDVTTLAMPSGAQEGDVAVVFSGRNDAVSCSTPTDFVSLKTQSQSNLTSRLSRKIMGPSPDSAVNGLDALGNHVVVVLRNVDQATPMDATPLSTPSTNGPADPPAIDVSTIGAMILIGAVRSGNDVITPPTGYTVLESAVDGGYNKFVVLAYKSSPANPGTHNPSAFSDPGNGPCVSHTAAIRRA